MLFCFLISIICAATAPAGVRSSRCQGHRSKYNNKPNDGLVVVRYKARLFQPGFFALPCCLRGSFWANLAGVCGGLAVSLAPLAVPPFPCRFASVSGPGPDLLTYRSDQKLSLDGKKWLRQAAKETIWTSKKRKFSGSATDFSGRLRRFP